MRKTRNRKTISSVFPVQSTGQLRNSIDSPRFPCCYVRATVDQYDIKEICTPTYLCAPCEIGNVYEIFASQVIRYGFYKHKLYFPRCYDKHTMRFILIEEAILVSSENIYYSYWYRIFRLSLFLFEISSQWVIFEIFYWKDDSRTTYVTWLITVSRMSLVS